jgi:N-acetylmuramoyl-L-alanine amidase
MKKITMISLLILFIPAGLWSGTTLLNTNMGIPRQAAEGPVVEQAAVIETDDELSRTYIVCIDPGHQTNGNNDPEPIKPGSSETKVKVTQGTQGVATGKTEYALNLEAGLILEEILKNLGMEVHMTRSVNDVDISNAERAVMAGEVNADLFVRLHADGSPDPNIRGAHILVPDNSHPSTFVVENSERAAEIILQYLEKDIRLAAKPLSYRGDITGFNWSEVPVILLEMGYMSNPGEDRLMADPDYIRGLMLLLAEGIEAYMETLE